MLEERKMIRMLNENTIEVNLPNKLGYERIAMACSASFAKIVGFRPERIEDLNCRVRSLSQCHGARKQKHPDKRCSSQ